MNLARIHWPAAVVLAVLIAAIASTLLFGPSLGLRGEDLRLAVGAESTLGLVVQAVIPAILRARAAPEAAEQESEEP